MHASKVRSRPASGTPVTKNAIERARAGVVAKLRAAGVQVRDGHPTFRYTHQQSVVVDDAVALIMTLT